MTTPSWDDAYAASTPAPWDIGRPQPAFVRLAEQGLLAGRVLDSGCGTGEQTLLAAAHGADATGVDGSGLAIGGPGRRRPNGAWWLASKSVTCSGWRTWA
jgi:2-polyprenyl-3-methyl-5-hydroxy-6-metoxy-1,4-benzoquinol methylase